MDKQKDGQTETLQDKISEDSKKKRWTKPTLTAVELGTTAKTHDTVETGTAIVGFGPS